MKPGPLRLERPRGQLEHLELLLIAFQLGVQTDDQLLSRLDASLVVESAPRQLAVDPASLGRGYHTAEPVDLVDQVPRPLLDGVGQVLKEIASAERIGAAGNADLVKEHVLRAQGGQRRMLTGDRQCLVIAVDVQGLSTAQNGGEGLESATRDVDVDMSRHCGHTRGLDVKAEALAGRVMDPEHVAHPVGPHPPAGPELGDLLQEVVVGVEEESQARQGSLRFDSTREQLASDRLAVGQGERHFEGGVRTCLAVVVAADTHRVPARHLGDDPFGQVALQPEGGHRWQRSRRDRDRGLHQEIVLAGSGERSAVDAAALCGAHEHGQVGDRADRLRGDQRDADALKGYPREEIVEVLSQVDRDAAAPNVRHCQGIVGVEGAQARVVEDSVDRRSSLLQ